MLKDGKWVRRFQRALLIGGTEWDFFSTFDGKDMRRSGRGFGASDRRYRMARF